MYTWSAVRLVVIVDIIVGLDFLKKRTILLGLFAGMPAQ
jgi:hypothetical protein